MHFCRTNLEQTVHVCPWERWEMLRSGGDAYNSSSMLPVQHQHAITLNACVVRCPTVWAPTPCCQCCTCYMTTSIDSKYKIYCACGGVPSPVEYHQPRTHQPSTKGPKTTWFLTVFCTTHTPRYHTECSKDLRISLRGCPIIDTTTTVVHHKEFR